VIATPEIGVTGTQAGATDAQIDTLRVWFERFRERGVLWKNNGDCLGFDAQAGLLWKWFGGKLRLHVPDCDAKRAFLPGDAVEPPLPYLTRNRNIVDRSRALVAAPKGFSEELRSGTWATIRYARKCRLPVLIIFPDGSVAQERWRRDSAN
jgi:hypothetical protein